MIRTHDILTGQGAIGGSVPPLICTPKSSGEYSTREHVLRYSAIEDGGQWRRGGKTGKQGGVSVVLGGPTQPRTKRGSSDAGTA